MSNLESLNEFKDSCYININGKVTPAKEAKISIFDRGFLYGDSVYEVTYSEDGKLIFFDEHLDRLFNSANLLNMDIHYSREEIKNLVMDTLKNSKIPRAYVRIIITRGESELNLDPNISFHNNVVIIVKPQLRYPKELYTKGLHLIISTILRNDRKSVNPNAKSGNYLNNVMAINEAKTQGADDAIMLNAKGHITEGTTFNIWIVKNSIVKTPPETSGLLKGITREKVIQICKTNGIELDMGALTPQEIIEADEVFITSSTKGIMPVYKVNQTEYDANARQVTKKISHLYQTLITNKDQKD